MSGCGRCGGEASGGGCEWAVWLRGDGGGVASGGGCEWASEVGV